MAHDLSNNEESLAERVQRLADVESIKNLKASYFRHLDLQQWEELSSLFTADARFDLATSGDSLAFDAVSDWLANLQRFLPGGWSVHHGHMPEIHVTGDTAVGVWAMYDQVHPGPQSGREPFGGFGHYHERYRRVAGVWKISELRLTRLWVGSLGA